jgi:hypothetical protein
MNSEQQDAAFKFTMQAADLYRAQEAMRGQFSELAAKPDLDLTTLGRMTVIDEAIHKASIALSRSALDIASALRAHNTSTPSATSAATRPGADNSEQPQ